MESGGRKLLLRIVVTKYRHRFAKAAYGQNLYRGFESLPLRFFAVQAKKQSRRTIEQSIRTNEKPAWQFQPETEVALLRSTAHLLDSLPSSSSSLSTPRPKRIDAT